jgi:hypothetical protein
MKFLTALIFAFLVTPTFASMVALSTPGIFVKANTILTCNVTNVSAKTLANVTVSLEGSVSGVIAATSTFTEVVSGNTTGVSTTMINDTVRCVFNYSGSPKSVRADIEVQDASSGQVLTALAAN